MIEIHVDLQTADTDSHLQSDRAKMRELPEAEKAKIKEQVQEFVLEKRLLDIEVSKWDESSNDIIVLAKQMCMIMMEMTDFTRGKGEKLVLGLKKEHFHIKVSSKQLCNFLKCFR